MKLHFKQYSTEGEPLLILHGLFGSLSNWNWQARKLSEKFAVYSLDLRNHGASPHSEEMTYAAMAGDVLEFMDDNELQYCHLLGHSMGGKVAMQLALEQPQRVRRLVVADIAPVLYAGEHDEIFRGLLAIDHASLGSRRDADATLCDYEEDEQVRLFLLSNLLRRENGEFYWRINLPVLVRCYDHLREGLAGDRQFDGEVLFIKGAKSNYIREEHRDAILSRFPRAQVKTLMQAGHWLHAEKPQTFYRLAADFLAGAPLSREADSKEGEP